MERGPKWENNEHHKYIYTHNDIARKVDFFSEEVPVFKTAYYIISRNGTVHWHWLNGCGWLLCVRQISKDISKDWESVWALPTPRGCWKDSQWRRWLRLAVSYRRCRTASQCFEHHFETHWNKMSKMWTLQQLKTDLRNGWGRMKEKTQGIRKIRTNAEVLLVGSIAEYLYQNYW